MDHSPTSVHRNPYTDEDERLRFDWLRASIASGFIATFAMTICLAGAYAIVNALGETDGNTLQRWFAALSSNELTDNVGSGFAVGMVINLAMGLLWAMAYAFWFEPRLSGPSWRRGATFSLIPWLLSIVVFFPIAGIGIFGRDIDAGILPVLGNLVLHLVYGVTLGVLYAIDPATGVGSSQRDLRANASGERTATFGLLIGAVVGLVGGWLIGPTLDDLASHAVIAFAGALSGAAIGMLIGSFLGIKVGDDAR
jgi:hypothetical protein